MARLCPPTIEQYGASAGFNHRHEFLKDMIKEYEHRRNVVYEEIQALEGIFISKSEGAFYTVVKLPVEDSEEFVRWMLTDFEKDRKTVMLAPAAGFYRTLGKGKDEDNSYDIQTEFFQGFPLDRLYYLKNLVQNNKITLIWDSLYFQHPYDKEDHNHPSCLFLYKEVSNPGIQHTA
ncbi:hypothetical protein ES703_97369 [subsurface metagenome]